MADITELADAYHWNISRIAQAFGLHRDTVRKRLNDAGVMPVNKVGNASVYRLREVGPALFREVQQVNQKRAYEVDTLDPKSRKEHYQSENERLKFMAAEQMLLPIEEHRAALALALKPVVSFFDSLPDRMERLRLFTPPQLEALQEACDDQRQLLYHKLEGVKSQ
jgi:hypothetical protein